MFISSQLLIWGWPRLLSLNSETNFQEGFLLYLFIPMPPVDTLRYVYRIEVLIRFTEKFSSPNGQPFLGFAGCGFHFLKHGMRFFCSQLYV